MNRDPKEKLKALIEEGLTSGPATPMSDGDWEDMAAICVPREKFDAFKATPDSTLVLTKAASRASAHLGMSPEKFARSIGVNESMALSLARGEARLDPVKPEWELSLLLVRVATSLDILVGSDEQKAKDWMVGQNKALGGIPMDLVQDPEGLASVSNYLERMLAAQRLSMLGGSIPDDQTPGSESLRDSRR